MMAVIRDVAKRAGVSIRTVPKYLNKSHSLTTEYRNKRQNDVDELNYRPNKVTRSMRTNKSHFISVIIPDLGDVFYSAGFNSIIVHLHNCIYRAIMHIIDIGRKIIAFVNGPDDCRISKEKFNGFKKAM